MPTKFDTARQIFYCTTIATALGFHKLGGKILSAKQALALQDLVFQLYLAGWNDGHISGRQEILALVRERLASILEK
jgi:hypothetical protein